MISTGWSPVTAKAGRARKRNAVRQSNALTQDLAFYMETIESFVEAVDLASIEEKRRLLRTIVKKLVWDGENAHVYVFTVDGEVDLPPIEHPMYPLGEDSE